MNFIEKIESEWVWRGSLGCLRIRSQRKKFNWSREWNKASSFQLLLKNSVWSFFVITIANTLQENQSSLCFSYDPTLPNPCDQNRCWALNSFCHLNKHVKTSHSNFQKVHHRKGMDESPTIGLFDHPKQLTNTKVPELWFLAKFSAPICSWTKGPAYWNAQNVIYSINWVPSNQVWLNGCFCFFLAFMFMLVMMLVLIHT